MSGKKNEPNLEHQPPLREIWYHSLEATDITPYRQEGGVEPPSQNLGVGVLMQRRILKTFFWRPKPPKQKSSHCSAALLAFALPLTFSPLPLTL